MSRIERAPRVSSPLRPLTPPAPAVVPTVAQAPASTEARWSILACDHARVSADLGDILVQVVVD